MSSIFSQLERDKYWMQRALFLAERGSELGEVPVGAVIVTSDISDRKTHEASVYFEDINPSKINDESCIADTFNSPIRANDPTAHAEIEAIRQAGQTIQNYRLTNSTLYVTLEPCAMCVGAIIHARISRVVFGAFDPKTGAVTSQCQLFDAPHFNHRVEYLGGVLEKESSALLKSFFQAKRKTVINE